MKIEIESDYCKISLEKNGVLKQKLVSLGDLMDELSAYRSTNFGLLPRNLRIMESQGNFLLMGLEFPELSKRITIDEYRERGSVDVVLEDVKLPAGIFFIKLIREPGGVLRHADSFMFALRGKRGVSFGSDRLYKYPTPNIYDNGRICWGEVDIPEMSHLSAVEGLVGSFFANKFNSDLFSGKVTSEFTGKTSVTSYFTKLSKEERFKEEWLAQTNHTVGRISAVILKGDF